MSDFLTSRMGFFLLIMSFLVMAFVTLAASKDSDAALINVVATLGSLLSLVFAVVGYLSVRPTDSGIEEQLDEISKSRDMNNNQRAALGNLSKLERMPLDLLKIMVIPHTVLHGSFALNAWMTQIIFFVFWLTAWGIVRTPEEPLIFLAVLLPLLAFYRIVAGIWGITGKFTRFYLTVALIFPGVLGSILNEHIVYLLFLPVLLLFVPLIASLFGRRRAKGN